MFPWLVIRMIVRLMIVYIYEGDRYGRLDKQHRGEDAASGGHVVEQLECCARNTKG